MSSGPNRFGVEVRTELVRKQLVILTKANGQRVLCSPCILIVTCPVCRSVRGEACKGARGYSAGTHYARRDKARRERRRAAKRKARKIITR